MIARGQIDVTPLLSHVLNVADIERAFELAISRDEGAIKVSVDFA